MMDVREIAKRAVDGEIFSGQEAVDLAAIMLVMGSVDRWQFGAAIALEYLDRGDVESARAVLEDMLGDAEVSDDQD